MPPLLAPFLDQQLTGISTKLIPEGFIAESILTLATAKNTTGKIAGYTKDHLRIANTVAGSRGTYPRIEVSTSRTDTYNIVTHGLSTLLVEEDFDNSITPFDPRRDATEDLTLMLQLGKEKALADTLGLTGTYASGNFVTLSGVDQYNDYVNSDPLTDFSNARSAIWNKSGKLPNKAIMSWPVYNMLRYHPKILEVGFKYNRSGQLSQQDLAMILEVDTILIGTSVYNSAKQAQTDVMAPVWGKHLILVYAPDAASLKMQTFGFRVQKAGQSPRRVLRSVKDEPPGSELIQVDDKYDQLIIDNTCGYLIQNAIA